MSARTLADISVFFLQMKWQPDGRDTLLHKGIPCSSGIPADYGAATGSSDSSLLFPCAPTPAPSGITDIPVVETTPPLYVGHNAVPVIRTSGGPIGMVEEALNPTTQTLGELLDAYASMHVPEHGRNLMTQSPGNPHVRIPNDPQGIPEAPAGSELTVITQQLLKKVEAASNPAQGTPPPPRSGGVTITCLLPSDNRAQLAGMITDAFLVSVEVFQQECKFPAAVTLMVKVSLLVVNQHTHTRGWFCVCFGKLSSVAGGGMTLASLSYHCFCDNLHLQAIAIPSVSLL